ncbi:MAG TPA: hypothetical protein VFR67_21885 [Pilimelia sp.]|nr:hypothetical protein [Pilimelia sp.]
MSGSWAGGSTRAWRRIRAHVLARDGHHCRLRLPGVCTGAATHVHHTHGRAATGDDQAYLVAACAPCNLKIGDPSKPRGPGRRPGPEPEPRTRW